MNRRCEVRWEAYPNGKLLVRLVDAGEESEAAFGNPVAVATADIETRMDADEIAVRDHSDNEGMVDALMAAGVIMPCFTVFYVGSYNARFARCRLTPFAREQAWA